MQDIRDRGDVIKIETWEEIVSDPELSKKLLNVLVNDLKRGQDVDEAVSDEITSRIPQFDDHPEINRNIEDLALNLADPIDVKFALKKITEHS